MTKSEFNIQRDMWINEKDSEDNHRYNKKVFLKWPIQMVKEMST